MPADPLLNEQRILDTLSNPAVPLSPNGVRSICALVLMACYDRKVTREFMAEMVDRNQEIGILMADLEGAAKLRSCLQLLKPDVEPTKIDEQLKALCAQWNCQRKILTEKFTLVTLCPTLADKVS